MARGKTILLLLILVLVFGIKVRKDDLKVSGELGELDYNQARALLVGQVKSRGSKTALITLRRLIQKNNEVASGCHSLAHIIGYEYFEITRNFAGALRYSDEVCNSGFLHGVIERHFLDSDDISSLMRNLCKDVKSDSFERWQCVHGVGHGVMFYSENDLNYSLKLCSNYEEKFDRDACNNGVFMENFNVDQKLHLSEYLDSNNPFFPCNLQDEENKAACFFYSPTYFLTMQPGNYLRAFEWCQTAVGLDRSMCFSGVGSQMMKENINNRNVVEEYCMKASEADRDDCIRGAVGLAIFDGGSLEPALNWCRKIHTTFRNICLSVLDSRRSMFSN